MLFKTWYKLHHFRKKCSCVFFKVCQASKKIVREFCTTLANRGSRVILTYAGYIVRCQKTIVYIYIYITSKTELETHPTTATHQSWAATFKKQNRSLAFSEGDVTIPPRPDMQLLLQSAEKVQQITSLGDISRLSQVLPQDTCAHTSTGARYLGSSFLYKIKATAKTKIAANTSKPTAALYQSTTQDGQGSRGIGHALPLCALAPIYGCHHRHASPRSARSVIDRSKGWLSMEATNSFGWWRAAS